MRFREEGSLPLPGVFQIPSPSVPPTPAGRSRSSPALTSCSAGWGEAALGSAGLCGRKRRGAGAEEEEAPDAAQEPGRRSALTLRTQPRGGERGGGDGTCRWEGADLGSGLGGAWIRTPSRRGARAPGGSARSGPRPRPSLRGQALAPSGRRLQHVPGAVWLRLPVPAAWSLLAGGWGVGPACFPPSRLGRPPPLLCVQTPLGRPPTWPNPPVSRQPRSDPAPPPRPLHLGKRWVWQ